MRILFIVFCWLGGMGLNFSASSEQSFSFKEREVFTSIFKGSHFPFSFRSLFHLQAQFIKDVRFMASVKLSALQESEKWVSLQKSKFEVKKSNKKITANAKQKGISKEVGKSAGLQKTKRKASKRKVANAYNCSEYWSDEYTFGYIQVGVGCSSKDNLCIAFYHIERNQCENGDLIRYYCDPRVESLYSTKKIKCDKGCQFAGLSATCIK